MEEAACCLQVVVGVHLCAYGRNWCESLRRLFQLVSLFPSNLGEMYMNNGYYGGPINQGYYGGPYQTAGAPTSPYRAVSKSPVKVVRSGNQVQKSVPGAQEAPAAVKTPSLARSHSEMTVGSASETEEEAARKLEEAEEKRQKAKRVEEEKTHVKAKEGDKVGSDAQFRAGRYVVHKLLGKGVYGKVFECTDLKYEGCLVAVKIVRDLPEYRYAGHQEIKVLKTLNGACGVLRLCRDFYHMNHVCISVDLYGESLSQKLGRVKILTIEQVADVGLQVTIEGCQNFLYVPSYILQ